jgi:predicted O-methyltransferase YrrM
MQMTSLITKERWDVIADLLKTYNCKTMVEVGGAKGLMARSVLHLYPLEVLYEIEINPKEVEHLQKQSEIFPTTKIYTMSSKEASALIPNELDLVYIDADHSYESCKEDILLWSPKVKIGGIICGHDYTLENPGVIKAVDELFNKQYVNFEKEKGIYGPQLNRVIWWVHKTGDEIYA